MKFPSISIVIPTLNSQKTLRLSLKSIAMQDYPPDSLELIIADGGSTDGTLSVVESFRIASDIETSVYKNPLKTGEAGKAVGVRMARNELVALIDSDNILPDMLWLKKVTQPFEDDEIFGCEPIEYTYRREDNYITRYCALMGMNDPFCYFLGNYDRKNYINLRWTDLPVMGVKVSEKEVEKIIVPVNYINRNYKFRYLKVQLKLDVLPTLGANGTLVRRELLHDFLKSDYLFDIDMICDLVNKGHKYFAKLNIGIIHLFGDKIQIFYRKQNRRIRDYIYFNQTLKRSYPWQLRAKKKILYFIICCLFLFPLCIQSIKGYVNKRDKIWFLHPLFCWLTLWAYGWGSIIGTISRKTIERTKWSQ